MGGDQFGEVFEQDRCCWRQVAAAESARSANRSPWSDRVPCESFRWMTGPRTARSAGLLVGSTPCTLVKVQSAGQTLRRLLENRRCQRVCRLFGLAASSSCRSCVWIGVTAACNWSRS